MLGYGRDESAPTPNGVFRGVSWVGVTLLVNRSQHYWQTVSSCRGRFIVPAYI
ncbi:MAG: hypothetical protein HXN90_05540 [Prevotella pallens]|nr:hypothetical protein [Prevotella pallens]